MFFNKYFNFIRDVLFIRLYNFWINYLSSANFLYKWNFGSMALVCFIFQIVIGIFLAMYYKNDLNFFIVIEFVFFFFGFIFLKLINYFNIKFYAYIDILTFARKYSAIIKQTNKKKLSLRDQHPILFDFFKINKKVYYVDINLTHSSYVEGHETYWVGKDKQDKDIYVIVTDCRTKDISDIANREIIINKLKYKYKDFDATSDYDLDNLNYNINFVLLNVLKKKFETNDIYSLTDGNRLVLDLKINLLSDESIYQDNLLWIPLQTVLWKTTDIINKID
jgi:hypothetical protein